MSTSFSAPDPISESADKSEACEPIQRMHLSYVGDVDDPTFRYSAKVSARHAGVTGWISKAVHGFSDVCVQGTAEQIKYYKHSILRRARRHGLHCNVAGSEELSPVENETGFTFRLDMEF